MNPIEFLRWWRPSGVVTLSAIEPDGPIETRSWCVTPDTWAEVEGWIDDRQGKKNLYFIPNESKPLDKKPSKEDITEIHCAFTDADPELDSGYEVGRKKIMEVAEKLAASDLPPTVIIDSGHGINALWRFAEVTNNVQEFETVNKPFSEAMGGKGIYNVERLLRLPGTINLATKTKIKKGYPQDATQTRVLYRTDSSYSLDEIRAFVRNLPQPKLNGHASDVPHSSMHFYPDILLRWHGDKTGLNDQSRSAMDFSLGALLKLRGFSYEEMCQILRVFPYGRGEENVERDYRRIWERAAKSDEPAPPPTPRQIEIVDFHTLITEDVVEEPDYIEPDFAGPGSFVLIAGPPKAQKSFLLQEILISAAVGGSFLGGKFSAPRPLRVFYLQAEMNRKLLRKRAKTFSLLTAQQRELLKSNLIMSERFHMILNADGVKIAIETIKRAFPQEPPEVIAIDPLANVFDQENENDNAQLMRFILGRLEAIRQAINPMAVIILVHHAKKANSEDLARDPFVAIRGAGALRGYYDSAIVIFRKNEEEKTRQVHFELRGGESPEPMSCILVDGRFKEAAEARVEIDLGRQMLSFIRTAWDSGKPLSLAPQTKKEGRFAPYELARKFETPVKAVDEILTEWMRNDIIAIVTRDKHTRTRGIKVIGAL